eukprot:883828-Pyramimonas_sp.AAC.2
MCFKLCPGGPNGTAAVGYKDSAAAPASLGFDARSSEAFTYLQGSGFWSETLAEEMAGPAMRVPLFPLGLWVPGWVGKKQDTCCVTLVWFSLVVLRLSDRVTGK